MKVETNNQTKYLLVIIVILLIIVASGVGYIIGTKSQQKNNDNNITEENTKQSDNQNDASSEESKNEKPAIKENQNFVSEKTKEISLNGKTHELLYYLYGTHTYICCGVDKNNDLNSYQVEVYLDNKLVVEYISTQYHNIEAAIAKSDKRIKDKSNENEYLILEISDSSLFIDDYLVITETGENILRVGESLSKNTKLMIPFTDENKTPINLDSNKNNLSLGDNYIYTYKSSYDESKELLSLQTLKYEIVNGTAKETIINTYTSTDRCGDDTISVVGQC